MTSTTLLGALAFTQLLACALSQIALPKSERDLISRDWPLFLAKTCGRWCENGSLVVQPYHYCVFPRCFPCDCQPACHVLGTCCPTIQHGVGSYTFPTDYDVVIKSSKTMIGGDKNVSYVCSTLSPATKTSVFPGRSVLMVRSCPETSRNTVNSMKCLGSWKQGYNFADAIPVCNAQSRICYANFACVMCQTKMAPSDEFQRVDIISECVDFDSFSDYFWQYLVNQQSETLGCSARLIPERQHVQTCRIDTGPSLPLTRDGHTLKSLCSSLPELPALSVVGNGVTQNIFCALKRSGMEGKCPNSFGGPSPPQHSRDVRVHQLQPREGSGEGCIKTKASKSEDCWPVTCRFGRVLTDDGRCVSNTAGTYGVWYEMVALFTPLRGLPADKSGLTVSDPGLGVQGTFYLSIDSRKCQHDDGTKSIVEFVQIKYLLKGRLDRPSDDFEAELVDAIKKVDWVLTASTRKEGSDQDKKTHGEEYPLQMVCVDSFCGDFSALMESIGCTYPDRVVITSYEWAKDLQKQRIGGGLTCPSIKVACVWPGPKAACGFVTNILILDFYIPVQSDYGLFNVSDMWSIADSKRDGFIYICLLDFLDLIFPPSPQTSSSASRCQLFFIHYVFLLIFFVQN